MIISNSAKKTILVLIDIFLLYFSLFITLIIRDFSMPGSEAWKIHLLPFSIINTLWLLIFYIAGFYDTVKKPLFYLSEIFVAMTSGGVIAVFLFYLFPFFGITPKTNLIIDILIVSFLIWGWRLIFVSFLTRATKVKIYFWGQFKEKEDLIKTLFGYEHIEDISQADIIIVSETVKKNPEAVESLYKMLHLGKTIVDFDKFYESLTGKIPVSTIDKAWFLENLMEINKQTFRKFKRAVDVIFSLFLFIPLIILFPFVALTIKINSSGPVLYRQKRVGRNGKIFELIKFRSMLHNSESPGSGWKKPEEKDERITFTGNILRKTRIDELPQIWNVLKGDISFVGPRPERPEFVKELEKGVPYYSIRQIVKPGLTGWAQINFGDASAKDALEKLQYDLYYIKNRSPLLDTVIFFKTIMVVLQTSGK
ncbi:MAG: sugar transferase [Candidatus Parcubacteria bacterium]|nr:sugar transferase [Candidatus Parcubacteria bacterium]